jgi:catechol 2,3-dioxygenase-like lactoylglutathione lyase family enzyme
MNRPVAGSLHHVEVWVSDLQRTLASWGWLLEELGYDLFQNWAGGRSWRLGQTYLVFEQSPDLSADEHDRRRPGLNHLAFHLEDTAAVDRLVEQAVRNGWTLMFPERHPHAGGEQHYAAYLEDADGFEVELVAFAVP